MKTQSAKSKKTIRWKGNYRVATSPEDYLNQRLDKSKDCWIWLKSKDKDGYGQCQASKYGRLYKVTRAHQLAYVTWVGAIPQGKIICHTCDTPSCCNPTHLYAGSWRDNLIDSITRDRRPKEHKRKCDYNTVIQEYGKLSCEKTAQKYSISWSLVCQIWRGAGLTGKNWHKGVLC